MPGNFNSEAVSASEAEQFLKDRGIGYDKRTGGTLFIPGILDISNKGLARLPNHKAKFWNNRLEDQPEKAAYPETTIQERLMSYSKRATDVTSGNDSGDMAAWYDFDLRIPGIYLDRAESRLVQYICAQPPK